MALGPLTVDPSKEPGVAACVLLVRDWIRSNKRGEFKVYVRDGDVRPVVDERTTIDIFQKYLGGAVT